jgi:hypothetical protein
MIGGMPDVPEFGGEENVISFSRPFEPFPQEGFAIAIQAAVIPPC